MAIRLRSTMAVFMSVVALLMCRVSCIKAQVRGYTLSQVIGELRSGGLSESTMTRVQTLCLAFVITAEVERKLVEAGATPELIAELRDTCNSAENPWSGSKVQRFSVQAPGELGGLGALPGRIWGHWFVAPVDCTSVGSRYLCHFHVMLGDDLGHHVCIRAATIRTEVGPSSVSRPAGLALSAPRRRATTASDSLPATKEACRTVPAHGALSLVVRADMDRPPSVGQRATVSFTLAEADKNVKGHGSARFAFRRLAVPVP